MWFVQINTRNIKYRGKQIGFRKTSVRSMPDTGSGIISDSEYDGWADRCFVVGCCLVGRYVRSGDVECIGLGKGSPSVTDPYYY